MKVQKEKDEILRAKLQEAMGQCKCEEHGTKARVEVDKGEVKLENPCCDTFEKKVGNVLKGFIKEFDKVEKEAPKE